MKSCSQFNCKYIVIIIAIDHFEQHFKNSISVSNTLVVDRVSLKIFNQAADLSSATAVWWQYSQQGDGLRDVGFFVDTIIACFNDIMYEYLHCWSWVKNILRIGRNLNFLAMLIHSYVCCWLLNTFYACRGKLSNSIQICRLLYFDLPFHWPPHMAAMCVEIILASNVSSPGDERLQQSSCSLTLIKIYFLWFLPWFFWM